MNLVITVDHATLKDDQKSSPHEQLPQPGVLADRQQKVTDVTDDVVMRDDVDLKEDGMVSHEQVQGPGMDRTEVVISRPSVVSSPVSTNTSDDAMDVDQKRVETEKVNKNDTNVDDVDMDASSDEDEDQEKSKEVNTESSSEADETSDEEEDDSDEDQPQVEPVVQEQKPRPTMPITYQMMDDIQEKPANSSAVDLGEANLQISVPEQRKQAKELVDPIKVCNKTTLPIHPSILQLALLLIRSGVG